jgi:hypothetical protein
MAGITTLAQARAIGDKVAQCITETEMLIRLFSCESKECEEAMQAVFMMDTPESRAMLDRLTASVLGHLENKRCDAAKGAGAIGAVHEAMITRLFSCETKECEEVMKRMFDRDTPDSRRMKDRLVANLFDTCSEGITKGMSRRVKREYLVARGRYEFECLERQVDAMVYLLAVKRAGQREDDVVLRREEWDALLADDEDRPERTADFVRELQAVLEPRDWGTESAKQRQERSRRMTRMGALRVQDTPLEHGNRPY